MERCFPIYDLKIILFINPLFHPKILEKSRLPPLSKTAKGIYYIPLFERQVVQATDMRL